jgi:hypothetical protein
MKITFLGATETVTGSKYLLNHNKELYDDLDKFVDSMDPNPCKEFIKKHEKEEKLKYILEQKEEIINFSQIFYGNESSTNR